MVKYTTIVIVIIMLLSANITNKEAAYTFKYKPSIDYSIDSIRSHRACIIDSINTQIHDYKSMVDSLYNDTKFKITKNNIKS